MQFSPGWCRGWQMRVVIARQVHMRIPVSFSDHAEVFPRQIELLRQRFAPTLGVDAPYADFFAKLMGYSSYDDLLEARVENVLEHSPSVTRYALHEGMIWNAFSQGCCSYLDACSLIDLLDYELFDCTLLADAPHAVISTLASIPGLVSKDDIYQAKRKKYSPFSPKKTIIFINSMGCDQKILRDRSREIVKAGAPTNEVTIFQDGRGFCWSRVRAVIMLLPSDFDERLSKIIGYAELDEPLARRMKFWREEIVSPLHEPAWAVVNRNRIIPEGFETVLNNGSAYLYNKVLQGYIPYSFEPESQFFFEAIVQIISGKVVFFDESELKPVDELGFRKVYREQDRNSNNGSGDEYPPLGRTVKSIPVKFGEMFYENWQPYLRAQRWIQPSDLSSQLARRCAAKVIHPDRLSPLAVPTWHATFTEEIRNELDETLASGIKSLVQLLKDGDLEKIVNNLATYFISDLDQRVMGRIQKMTKTECKTTDEGDKFVPEVLKVAKIQYPQKDLGIEGFEEICHSRGSCIKKGLMELSGLGDSSLGWIDHEIERLATLNPSKIEHYVKILSIAAWLVSDVENFDSIYVSSNSVAAALFGMVCLANGLSGIKNGYTLTELQKTSVIKMSTLPGCEEFLRLSHVLAMQESFISDVKSWQLNEAQRSERRKISDYVFANGLVDLDDEVPSTAFHLGGESAVVGKHISLNSDTCKINITKTNLIPQTSGTES